MYNQNMYFYNLHPKIIYAVFDSGDKTIFFYFNGKIVVVEFLNSEAVSIVNYVGLSVANA